MDVPQGKNLIGAFHHPAVVYMDPQTLMSIDERNYCGGLVELVKTMALSRMQIFWPFTGRTSRQS